MTDPTTPAERAEAAEALARSLAGQVAVVTGGGGVIGRGVAERFAEAGARVVLGDLDADRARAAAEAIGGEDRARAVEVDVTSQSAARRFIDGAAAAFGRLDVLVNAAGATHVDPLLDVTAETWRQVFRVNLDGALFCLQAAARTMGEQEAVERTGRRGAIVNIGSQGSGWPMPTSAAYGASKRALIHLAESAAVALEATAISVNVVLPGMVYEGMWKRVNAERARMTGEDFGARVARDVADTPSGRFQTPRELAEVVLFAATAVGLELSGKVIWSEPHAA